MLCKYCHHHTSLNHRFSSCTNQTQNFILLCRRGWTLSGGGITQHPVWSQSRLGTLWPDGQGAGEPGAGGSIPCLGRGLSLMGFPREAYLALCYSHSYISDLKSAHSTRHRFLSADDFCVRCQQEVGNTLSKERTKYCRKTNDPPPPAGVAWVNFSAYTTWQN